MANLYFIRNTTLWGLDSYYEEMTEVWVLGDVAGYKYFIASIESAKRASTNVHLTEIPGDSYSMGVIILPAAEKPQVRPRLKVVERLVRWQTKPKMEMIVYGNRPGYDDLIEFIEMVIDRGTDDPDDHYHLDTLLVQRSIALNIRGPLATWDLDQLSYFYRGMITTPSRSYLPPYAELEAGDEYYEPEGRDYSLVK